MKRLPKKIWLNPYLITGAAFLVWMYFFDANSIKINRSLNKEIHRLEESIRYYDREIAKDRKIIEVYRHNDSLEKFAREQYGLKKENEDVYVIK